MKIARLDAKHRIEYEKDKPENRRKRLEDSWPLPYPFAIAIETSNNCNSSCVMCPRRDMKRSLGNMSLHMFRKILDELYENQVVLRKMFFHWMGEPLMNPHIAEIISYAAERNIAEILVMGTNSIELKGQLARDIIASGLDEIFISLDANTSEMYSNIKGHDVHFSQIEDNIRRFVELKAEMKSNKPYVRLKMLKMEINKHEVNGYIAKWRDTVDEVYIENDLNAWNGTNSSVNNAIGADNVYRDLISGSVGRFPCERLWYQLAISWDGRVSPCIADWDMVGGIGNVSQNTLFDIWNQPVLVAIRENHIDGRYEEIGMCAKCMRWIFRKPGDWIYNKKKSLRICRK